jgi:hypothetical protein
VQLTEEPIAKSTQEALQSIVQAVGEAGRLRRDALEKFSAAGPMLVDAMRHQSGQAEKVRQIVWSIYTGSHLVALGHVCAGLDAKVAEAVAAVITARLLVGADIEEPLKSLMIEAGEFIRYDEAEASQATKGLPFCYPIPMASSERLRELADSVEALEI